MFTDLLPALPDWLARQRWYAGKGLTIQRIELVGATDLRPGEEPRLQHLLIDVDCGDRHDRYQLLCGWRPTLPARLEHAAIGPVEQGWAYEAVHDSELTARWAALMAEQAEVGALRFRLAAGVDVATNIPSLLTAGEQSNTSIVYGEDYICKLFRRVAAGRNPDLELSRALAEAGSPHVAPPLAWVEAERPEGTYTLAILSPYLRSASDGWALAETSLRDLYAEADLHADEVGGDFAGEAERLGAATAEVHQMLARVLPSEVAPADEIAMLVKRLRERLDAAVEEVPELVVYAAAIQSAYEAVVEGASPMPVQRIHGDFHLGQVMRTDTGWVLFDFEGEPARPLEERVALASPLVDIAGMLRSFDYAAHALIVDSATPQSAEYRAGEWVTRNIDAFCSGYAAASGTDPRDQPALLKALELDKAVYEARYEARHRPSWLSIPLRGIERLTS